MYEEEDWGHFSLLILVIARLSQQVNDRHVKVYKKPYESTGQWAVTHEAIL